MEKKDPSHTRNKTHTFIGTFLGILSTRYLFKEGKY